MDEAKQLRTVEGGPDVTCCTPELIQFRISETPFKDLMCQLAVSREYPSAPLGVVLDSKVLPDKLLRKLQDHCEAECERLSRLGAPQIIETWRQLSHVLKDNLLLLNGEEIAEIRGRLLHENDTLKVYERKGLCRFSCGADRFRLEFDISVPRAYPKEPVGLRVNRSTFPEDLTALFLGQATEVARRCAAGVPLDASLRALHSQQPGAEPPRPTASLLQMRHDLKFLKECGEYAALSQDKQMRRDKKRLEKREAKAENSAPVTAPSEETARPLPSLLPVTEFILLSFVRGLPEAVCWGCRKPVVKSGDIATDPPMRALCGDWFHDSCLETLMTNPPFGKKCPNPKCGAPVLHSKWNSRMEHLERAWALREARKRDEEDVADFLGI